MQAIILAAGMGKRLGKLTQDNTKCMVKVNGVSLIERLLGQIDDRDLSRIVIVAGYKGKELKDYVSTLKVKTPIVFVDNPYYETTNNIYSLYLAKDYLCQEDTLLFESDLIFEDSVIDLLINDKRKTLVLVDKYESWMDGTCVRLGDDCTIDSFVPKKSFDYRESDKYYKTVNIYKFGKSFSKDTYVPFLEAYTKAFGKNEYYEEVLRAIAIVGDSEIRAEILNGQLWYEIDDIQDLDIASTLFSTDLDEKLTMLQDRYGGYWRYPKLIDFCYLVNPYYPPERMVDEMKSNYGTLLTQYPSGMGVNSLLAGKNFGVDRSNIVVGNGAAELIKSMMESMKGKVGFIRPTFEEYINRYSKDESVYYCPDNEDYSYDADDIIGFFDKKRISTLVLVNPDNPSGNYIDKEGLMKLVDWTKKMKIRFILDESFVDFADEEDSTLIDQEILDGNPHLYVIKSISKSYGVPGLRLGVLASGDVKLIESVKKDVSIWNINSFAEFYLQIESKYKSDYIEAMRKFRKERARYVSELEKIPYLRVIPSQANYVMAEVKGRKAKDLVKSLLVRYDILIKDLTKKTNGKEFVRIAIRDRKDNDKLIAALKKEQ